MKPVCNATSWGRYFRYRYWCLGEALAAIPNSTIPGKFRRSQQEEMNRYLEHLGKPECPPFQDGGCDDERFTDLLADTIQDYDTCTANAWNITQLPSALIGSEPHGYDNDTDPAGNVASIPISMHCLMQAVSKVTRPGFEVTIHVQRYRG